MNAQAQTFGSKVKEIREARRLTTRQLAKLADMAQENISTIETSQKPCGPVQAEKLAKAFNLHGIEAEAFMFLAITSTKKPIVGAVVKALEKENVRVTDIVRAGYQAPTDTDLFVQLRNGSLYVVKIEVKKLS